MTDSNVKIIVDAEYWKTIHSLVKKDNNTVDTSKSVDLDTSQSINDI